MMKQTISEFEEITACLPDISPDVIQDIEREYQGLIDRLSQTEKEDPGE